MLDDAPGDEVSISARLGNSVRSPSCGSDTVFMTLCVTVVDAAVRAA